MTSPEAEQNQDVLFCEQVQGGGPIPGDEILEPTELAPLSLPTPPSVALLRCWKLFFLEQILFSFHNQTIDGETPKLSGAQHKAQNSNPMALLYRLGFVKSL